MLVLLVILVLALAIAAYAAVGHLNRIADAIEAQNRAYGVGASDEKPAPEPEPQA